MAKVLRSEVMTVGVLLELMTKGLEKGHLKREYVIGAVDHHDERKRAVALSLHTAVANPDGPDPMFVVVPFPEGE
jgi:hypothetical protein